MLNNQTESYYFLCLKVLTFILKKTIERGKKKKLLLGK